MIDNEDEIEFDPIRIHKNEFTSEEYEALLLGRVIGKDGFLYEIQGDGSIMMIDVCEQFYELKVVANPWFFTGFLRSTHL